MTSEAISFPRDYNAAVDLLDSNIQQGRGDNTAFIDPYTSLTYADLEARANKVANLWGRLGIGREARIAQVMIDTVDFPAVFLGSIKAGVIPIPLNTLLSADYYRYIFNDSRCQAIVVSAPLLAVVEEALEGVTSVQHVIVVGGDGTAMMTFTVWSRRRTTVLTRPEPAATRLPSGSIRRARPACPRASSISIRA